MVQSSAGGRVAEIASTFGVDWPHLAAQVISFAIVCALLYWLAYEPVLRMLEERRKQIAQGLANAEKINATLAAIETQRQEVMTAAHAAAEQIVEKAHDAAAQEHTRMMAELRREVGQLVVKTTAAVTGKILSVDDQRRLAEETA